MKRFVRENDKDVVIMNMIFIENIISVNCKCKSKMSSPLIKSWVFMRAATLVTILGISSLTSKAQKQGNTKKISNQYELTDKKALAIPEAQTGTTLDIAKYIATNFSEDSDIVRAIFIWTATNISYDVENMFAINFYETTGEKITNALKNRKGICANYAALFNEICQKSGLRSYIIRGYTKQNGFADYIPHVWCAVLVKGSWFLFDPTWGSGYMSNAKFVKKINNAYYKVPPSKLIKSHMPFDPMWEFLNYPVTNQEFYEGKIQENKSKPYFSYVDSIAAYDKQSLQEQNESTSRRIEANGVKNAMIFDQLEHLKRAIETDRNQKEVTSHNEKIELYNSAVTDYTAGVNNFNAFIQYRNNQFKPMVSDAEIQGMFDAAYNKVLEAKNMMERIKKPDASIAKLIITFNNSIEDAINHLIEQKVWLEKYFSKGKFGRAGMFTKYTWMGIPLN